MRAVYFVDVRPARSSLCGCLRRVSCVQCAMWTVLRDAYVRFLACGARYGRRPEMFVEFRVCSARHKLHLEKFGSSCARATRDSPLHPHVPHDKICVQRAAWSARSTLEMRTQLIRISKIKCGHSKSAFSKLNFYRPTQVTSVCGEVRVGKSISGSPMRKLTQF